MDDTPKVSHVQGGWDETSEGNGSGNLTEGIGGELDGKRFFNVDGEVSLETWKDTNIFGLFMSSY